MSMAVVMVAQLLLVKQVFATLHTKMQSQEIKNTPLV
jgi:hypothetical protein